MTLQNDSDGGYARFYFKKTGGQAPTDYVVVYGVDRNEVNRWNGDNGSYNPYNTTRGSGIQVLPSSAFTTDCASAEYNAGTATFGSYASHGSLGVDYVCVNFTSLPPWAKRHFKVGVANYDGNGNNGPYTFSEIRTYQRVPTGMVGIAWEDWPNGSNYPKANFGP